MSVKAEHFGFSKLLVADLERCADFYKAAFGLSEMVRVDSEIAGRPISEIMFNPTAEGAATFVLLTFNDVEKPSAGEVILGFQVTDLEALVTRAQAAGAEVVDEIRAMPEHGVKVAFIKDVEGHLIEVVELLAGGH